MFSNTALAHRLKKTQDWVLLYYDDDAGERQCTVITSHQAPFSGKRIVRGREEDCGAYSQSREAITTEVPSPGS